MSDNSPQNLPFSSAAEYVEALDMICASAKQNLYIFEQNFTNIGFNNIGRYESLRRFLLESPNNKLQMLAHDTRPISQYSPRLMTLLRQFGHNMFIYQTPKHLQHLSEPFAIADETSMARRFHMDTTRGSLVHHDTANIKLYKSRFLEMWQASQPSPHTSGFVL